MKKTLLIAIVGAVMAMSSAFAQHTQSLSFTGPTIWNPGTTLTLGVDLTFSGYSSYGLSYWIELPNPIVPFLQVNMPAYFVFTDGNNVNPWPATWSNIGAHAGYMSEGNDLGATTQPLTLIPPGTYHIADIPISVLAGAIGVPGTYTLHSTVLNTHVSEVSDDQFNDNNLPAASFVFTIVPEPSTLALLGLAAVGSLVAIRRGKS